MTWWTVIAGWVGFTFGAALMAVMASNRTPLAAEVESVGDMVETVGDMVEAYAQAFEDNQATLTAEYERGYQAGFDKAMGFR